MSGRRPYRFALLSHMPLKERLSAELMQDTEFTLDYFHIPYAFPLFGVQELLDQGYEVVLMYSSFGPNVLQHAGHAVVLVAKTDMDVIKALLKARVVSREVALPVHANENIDVAFLEQLLDMRIHALHYGTVETLQQKITEVVQAGVRVLLGGGVSAVMAERLSVDFFRVAASSHSLSRAFEQAKGLARARREECKSKEQLVAVLRLFREGVICVDAQGAIIFSNAKAYELLKVDRAARDGSAFSSYISALMLEEVLADGRPREEVVVCLQGEQFMVTTLPVFLHSSHQGAVAFFSDVNALQSISGRLRASRRQAGFQARFGLDDFKGESPAVKRLKSMVALYAPHSAAVFLHGETGTGKEVLAQALHNAGPRRRQPFVAVNCAALPDSLLESELFGYEEGAFTGARKGGKPGVFELAHKGTLFLDEIGDMGTGAQLRLLRVLESRELIRVGGNRVIPVDIRVVSASHAPLLDLVRQGSFRPDLFYRLAVLRLYLPPVRQRREDIPLLLEALLSRYGARFADFTPTMRQSVDSYAWPGNVRELLAFVESYLILLQGRGVDEKLFVELLDNWTHQAAPLPSGCAHSDRAEPDDLKVREREARARHARKVVDECGGNKRRPQSAWGSATTPCGAS